jgi:hypothetical protein
VRWNQALNPDMTTPDMLGGQIICTPTIGRLTTHE